MKKYTERACVLAQTQLAKGVYDMRLQTSQIAKEAVPGQFVSLYTDDPSKILPRPISLCEIDRKQGILRLVYRVTGAGTGTESFSKLKAGDDIRMMGPLGNGFPLMGEKPLVIGGGIGVPPMLQLAKELPGKVTAVMGYRDGNTFLKEDFEQTSRLLMATENGSVGTKGTVLDAIKENQVQADVIFACGPKPMLKALKAYAAAEQIPCYISLEERMACGIGACLACVCETKNVDAHSQVHNQRICKDGPVFLAEEVEL